MGGLFKKLNLSDTSSAQFSQDSVRRRTDQPSFKGYLAVLIARKKANTMISRKHFLGSAAALGTLPLAGCTQAFSAESYDAAVQKIWHPELDPTTRDSDGMRLQRKLVRYACLAPSSHNTQPWQYRLADRAIVILPDLRRRTAVVDPDDHHLFVSLGCALENMAQAGAANGLMTQAQFDPPTGSITVRLEPKPPESTPSPLYAAISERQCTRGPFDGQSLSLDELKALEKAGNGSGVSVVLITAKPEIEKILELVMAGNSAQLADKAFVAELKHWLRFSASEAVAAGDGLYSASSGNPTLPRWLGGPMFDIMLSAKTENEKYAAQVRSSAGIAVFVSNVNDKSHWIEAGRCYERFALQATALGIRNAMLNQAVEVPAQRLQLAALLGVSSGGRPDLVVRFGRGPKMPQSLRRDVSAVLV
jgi:hypothetical protein